MQERESKKLQEAVLRKYRCCFTGHRPEKLRSPEWLTKRALRKEIQDAINDGYSEFITGMSRGMDIWAGEIILDLKAKGVPVRLICAVPHPDFEQSWSNVWQHRYQRILQNADLVRTISPAYYRGCYQVRNQWMVDHSARVIAVFVGITGGTFNTLEYAIDKGVETRIVRR